MIGFYIFFMSFIYGINPSLPFSIVKVESNFKSNVIGDKGKSFGLFQVKCSTARGLGYKGKCKELLDPYVNTNYGLMYLSYHNRRYIKDTISAYNAGRPFLCRHYKKKCRKFKREYVNNKYVDSVIKNYKQIHLVDVL
jgi:soluble lytic murein transglycosylase-like protein